MNKKKLVAMALVGTMLMTLAPTISFAEENESAVADIVMPALGQVEMNLDEASAFEIRRIDSAVQASNESVVFASGNGSAQDPYVIDTAAQLKAFQASVSADNTYAGQFVKLGASIDLKDIEWTPINDFAGTFDGDNHVISNLSLKGTNQFLGFFGKTGACTIKNLVMDGVTIDGETTSNYAAAVVGSLGGGSLLENISVKNLSGRNALVAAGLVAGISTKSEPDSACVVRQCSVNTASFSDCTYANGMMYQLGKYTTMEDCHVSNLVIDRTQVTDQNTYGSGLFFMSSDGASIKGCSTEKVTINNTTNASGFLYRNGVDTTVESCSANQITFNEDQFIAGFSMFINTEGNAYKDCHVTQVTAENIEKGGVGMVYYLYPNLGASLTDCSVTDVRIDCAGLSAGFMGSGGADTNIPDKELQLSNCHVTNVYLENGIESAGFICTVGAYSQLDNCSATNVTLSNIATGSGLVRYVKSHSNLSNCRTKNVQFIAPQKDLIYVGGLIGMINADVAISDCRVDGITIQGKSGMQVGGFTGNVQNSSSTAPNTFTNCVVSGLDMQIQEMYPYKDTEHKSKVGGFIGTTGKIATFNNCSVDGKIQAADSAGGFVGDLGWVSLSDENAATYRSEFTNCTADVDVTAGNSAGGFVGIAVSTYTQQNGKPNPEKSTATFNHCVAKGKVTGTAGVAGGFVGTGDRGDYIACRAEGAVDGDVAGGFFGKAIPNEFSDGTDTQVTFAHCAAAGTVLGGTQAGGFMGQAETETSASGDSDTLITFNTTNIASPVVVGSTKQTVVEKVVKVEDDDLANVTGLPTEMPNTALVTPKGDDALSMDTFGHIVIPPSGANKDDQSLMSGDVISNKGALVQGGRVENDGAITIGSGGSLTKPDGSVEKFPYGGTIGSEGDITTNPSPSTPSRPFYNINVTDVSNGVVETTPVRAKKGTTVTVIVTPDAGYVADEIVVTDKNGEKIGVTDAGDGKYTFIMPAGHVEISVTFKKAVASDDWDNPFTDVPQGAWYNEAVRYVYENGLMVGLASNIFGSNVTADRGQLVTMLWRMAGEPTAQSSASFSDVQSSAYYAKAVAWAAEKGITAGFEDGTFRPQAGLSREQMAALFMNYAEVMGVDTSARADISSYTDINPNSWSYDALSWAKAVGLLSGTSDTTMAPQATATRAQIAAVLQRYCETVAK